MLGMDKPTRPIIEKEFVSEFLETLRRVKNGKPNDEEIRLKERAERLKAKFNVVCG